MQNEHEIRGDAGRERPQRACRRRRASRPVRDAGQQPPLRLGTMFAPEELVGMTLAVAALRLGKGLLALPPIFGWMIAGGIVARALIVLAMTVSLRKGSQSAAARTGDG